MPGEVLFLMFAAFAMIAFAGIIYCDYSEQIDEVWEDD